MEIRKYREGDREAVQSICIATAKGDNKSEREKEFLTELYCDYYITHEPDNCFVIDEGGNAVGYILCAEDFGNYKKLFCRDYMRGLRRKGLFYALTARCEVTAHGAFKRRFPAHMHIDILPEYQHKGLGTALINALKENLAAKGIHSLMLIVGADNKAAVAFYKKNGFKSEKNLLLCYVMTLKF